MDNTKLYSRRQLADLARQPAHGLQLGELHTALSNLKPPKTNPYSLGPADYMSFSREQAYSSVCLGRVAKVKTSHCFRLTTWKKLLRDLTHATSLLAPLGTDESQIFALIEDMHRVTNDWVPLSLLVLGTLTGPRGFTWWTPTPISTTRTMCSAHDMGLLNNETGTEILILRCSTRSLIHFEPKVPSVLDAFFFHIFCPTRDIDKPSVGRAISVETPEQLTLGAEEMVVGHVDLQTAQLDVWPVNLKTAVVHQVYMDDIFNSLMSFYEAAVDD